MVSIALLVREFYVTYCLQDFLHTSFTVSTIGPGTAQI